MGRYHFSCRKIYQNEFVLEYKIDHPQEVLDALAAGATITPVMNIATETLKYSDGYTILKNFFNFEQLSPIMPSGLPEKSECKIYDNYVVIKALPKLNCQPVTLKDIIYFYPHRIPRSNRLLLSCLCHVLP